MIRKAHPFTFALTLALSLGASSALAATLTVGPGKTYAKPCDAGKDAKDGDTIEIEGAGNYTGDVCTWSQNNLTFKGVNGRPKIDAAGVNIPNGKGIWVFYGDTTTVENIEFSGASVDSANGAGIRHQGVNLTVRDCYFHDNQNGILGSPNKGGVDSPGQGEVLIERCEFAKNGAGDGKSHNMYLGPYAKFTLQYSYSHSSNVGHLVKVRAVESHILYNRLTDDESTNVSYEVNLPDGGRAYVIGNLIEQASDPNGEQNGAIIDFASESAQAVSDLFVVNNTVVNNRTKGGTFVQIKDTVTTPAVLRNNVFSGNGTICSQAAAVLDHNFSMGDPKLVDAAGHDFHLLAGSPCAEAGVDPGMGDSQSLTPTAQYVHPLSFENRTTVGTIDIGAYELGGGSTGSTTSSGTGAGTGSASTGSGAGAGGSASTGATSGAGGSAGTSGAGGSGGGSATPGTDGGCGCAVAGDDHAGHGAAALLVLAAALISRRRRAS
jgi:MYXO-CTERM domain-containing protein